MEDQDLNEFLFDEYREKWTYIRHMEVQSQRYSQWFYTIVGASLAYTFEDVRSVPDLTSRLGGLFVLLFCTLYAVLIALFLIVQKRNYKIYNDRLLELERLCGGFSPSFLPRPILTTFRLIYAFPTIIGAACFAISLKILGLENWVCILGFAMFLSIMFGLTFVNPDRIRSTGVPADSAATSSMPSATDRNM